MDMELQIEPIVSRDEIMRRAREAAERCQSVHDSNPYLPGTQAHRHFQRDYWERDRELCGDEAA